jgi:hypothetical protein
MLFPLIGLIEKVIYHFYIELATPIATHVYMKKNLIEFKIIFNIYKDNMFIRFKIILFFYLYFLITFCHTLKLTKIKLYLFKICQNI